ncbi:Vomeronasal type-1 receptor 4 [Lemmus lemmus]
MNLKYLAVGIVFLLQSTIGFLGNFSLLSYYLIRYCIEEKLKTKDLIFTHLFTANSLVIVSSAMLMTIQAFGMKWFISDFGCNLLLYIQRLGRNMSIGTICFLSIFQAITISPCDSCWKDLKVKAPKYIRPSISLCWVIYMVINLIFPLYFYIKRNSKNQTLKGDSKYCSNVGRDKIVDSLYLALLVFPEVLFSILIIWSSGSMVTILYRHKQQIQCIWRNQVSLRTSPESRATQSILVLVSTFVAFYTLSSILQGFIAVLYKPSGWLVIITGFISMCFPTLCPFLVSHSFIVLRFCLLWIRNIKHQ